MKTDWTAALPPTRTTGDEPALGPAGDMNLVRAALTEVRSNVPNTPSDIGAAATGHTHSGGGSGANAFGIYSVRDYGAVGENVTADTAGFKAARDAWLLHPGSQFHVPPPLSDGSYKLNQTIDFFNPASSQQQISGDITMHLSWHGIIWEGAGNTPIFRSRGLKDCTVSGVHATIGADVDNVVGWEMDVGVFGSVTYNSTGRVTFLNCFFSTNAGGASIIGWRMSHSSNTADVSQVSFINCNVQNDMGTSGGSRHDVVQLRHRILCQGLEHTAHRRRGRDARRGRHVVVCLSWQLQ
jgi:hypothetical protein